MTEWIDSEGGIRIFRLWGADWAITSDKRAAPNTSMLWIQICAVCHNTPTSTIRTRTLERQQPTLFFVFIRFALGNPLLWADEVTFYSTCDPKNRKHNTNTTTNILHFWQLNEEATVIFLRIVVYYAKWYKKGFCVWQETNNLPWVASSHKPVHLSSDKVFL